MYSPSTNGSESGTTSEADSLVRVQLGAVLIPVRSDGGPNDSQRLTATVVELGWRGLTLEGDRRALASPACVAAVRTPNGRTEYVGVQLALDDGRAGNRFWGDYGGPGHELLQPRNLMPRFHFESMTFTFGLPAAQLRSWAEAGVLQPMVLDELRLCRRCQAFPTYRPVCRKCGSPHLTSAGFGPDGKAYYCQDCQRIDSQRLNVAYCSRCQLSLTDQETVPLAVRGYHVQRLDLRAFLPST